MQNSPNTAPEPTPEVAEEKPAAPEETAPAETKSEEAAEPAAPEPKAAPAATAAPEEEDFAALLAEYGDDRRFRVGDVVRGNVVDIIKDQVIVDIGYKAEGIVPAEEFLLPDGELLLVAQIETTRAIDALAEIAAVPGVGALFLGPADLHADMGYLGQSGVPEVEAEIQRAVSAAQAAGVPIGITTNAETVAKRLAQGFTFVTIGFDVTLPEGVAAAAKAAGR